MKMGISLLTEKIPAFVEMTINLYFLLLAYFSTFAQTFLAWKSKLLHPTDHLL